MRKKVKKQFDLISTNFEHIDRLSTRVNDLLNLYVKIHRKIMRNTGIFRVIKNALGFKTNFQVLGVKTTEINDRFEELKEETKSFMKDKNKELTTIQKKYLNNLIKYIRSLITTTKHLVTILEVLHNINISSDNINNYDFDKINGEYMECIKIYRSNMRLVQELYSDLHAEILSNMPLSCDTD